MPHFGEVTEYSLRDMSRRATSLYLNQRPDAPCTPSDAVIKVASTFTDAPLTSEHARRICEMTYHDIFEQSFRDGRVGGPDRLVSFDPPDAEKVASAIRAHRLESFSDKTASATPAGGAAMSKTASAPAMRAPPAPNAFSTFVGAVAADTSGMKKEALADLRRVRDELREAESSLRVDLSTALSVEKVASWELREGVVHAAQQGVPPEQVVRACIGFAMDAGLTDEDVLEKIATSLFQELAHRGIPMQKTAGWSDMEVNERHPLRAQAAKVAGLLSFGVHGGAALQDVRSQRERVERELQDALYR